MVNIFNLKYHIVILKSIRIAKYFLNKRAVKVVRFYPIYTQPAKIISKSVLAVDSIPSLNFKIRIDFNLYSA